MIQDCICVSLGTCWRTHERGCSAQHTILIYRIFLISQRRHWERLCWVTMQKYTFSSRFSKSLYLLKSLL